MPPTIQKLKRTSALRLLPPRGAGQKAELAPLQERRHVSVAVLGRRVEQRVLLALPLPLQRRAAVGISRVDMLVVAPLRNGLIRSVFSLTAGTNSA